MVNPEYQRHENENDLDYAMRLIGIKKELKPGDLDWCDITELLGLDYNPDSLRKAQDSKFGGWAVYNAMKNRNINQEDIQQEITAELQELKELKCAIADERTGLNKLIKEKYRVEHIKEIALECVQNMEPLDLSRYSYALDRNNKALVVALSDFHYGLEINEFNNQYNTTVFEQRLSYLEEYIIKEVYDTGVGNVIVLGLGDLISGLIHNVIRISSRENVVQQVMAISNYLIEFLGGLSKYVHVDYYDCIGNHSRLFEDKDNCLAKESFDLLIHYILEKRFEDNGYVTIHDYTINEKIGTFNIFDKHYAFCHGDGFNVSTIAQDLSAMTKNFYEAIFIGHIHHFFAEEQNGTLVIANGSFAGNDEFSNKIRKTSIPSQNLFIISENGIEAIKTVRLNNI